MNKEMGGQALRGPTIVRMACQKLGNATQLTEQLGLQVQVQVQDTLIQGSALCASDPEADQFPFIVQMCHTGCHTRHVSPQTSDTTCIPFILQQPQQAQHGTACMCRARQ